MINDKTTNAKLHKKLIPIANAVFGNYVLLLHAFRKYCRNDWLIVDIAAQNTWQIIGGICFVEGTL